MVKKVILHGIAMSGMKTEKLRGDLLGAALKEFGLIGGTAPLLGYSSALMVEFTYFCGQFEYAAMPGSLKRRGIGISGDGSESPVGRMEGESTG
jgi:hypothetical protein